VTTSHLGFSLVAVVRKFRRKVLGWIPKIYNFKDSIYLQKSLFMEIFIYQSLRKKNIY
jgi:hypothetical protein